MITIQYLQISQQKIQSTLAKHNFSSDRLKRFRQQFYRLILVFVINKIYINLITQMLLKFVSMDNKNTNLQKIIFLVKCITDKVGVQNFAIILMVCANSLWPVSFIYVSQHNFSPFQTALVRGTSICITHIIICLFLGISLDFKTSYDLKYLNIRNFLILIHQIIYAGMYFVLSFPLNNSIAITGPLFVFVIDYYLNGITINKKQVIGIVIGFVGIFLNINGDFFMKIIDPTYEIHTTFENYYVTDIRLKIFISIIAFLTNIFWGYAIVIQKKINHIPGIKISFFLGIQFVFISGIIQCLGFVTPITFQQFFYGCIFSGVLMAFCQIMFISALNLSKNTGKLAILQLCYGISSYAISFFKYQEQINFICVIGLIIMGYGLYKTIFSKQIQVK